MSEKRNKEMENTQGGSKLKQERENEDSKRLVIDVFEVFDCKVLF